jgi:RecB family exonuclease
VEQRRGAAITRLAALAQAGVAGGHEALVAAHPDTWWGVAAVTPGATAPAGAPSGQSDATGTGAAQAGDGEAQPDVARLSPSAIEQLLRCPLQWFLERRVGAGTPPGAPATLGTIVHEVARAIADGEVAADMAAITPYVDSIWAGLPFPARYQSGHERERLDTMLRTLLRWLAERPGEVLAAEAAFTFDVATAAGPAQVRGTIDRVERDEAGRVHLVDFKTGRSVASQAATDEHAQLGVYQLAVREAGLGEVVPPGAPLAGAALVHLGETYADGSAKVRQQVPLEDGPTWVHELVADAVQLAAGPGFPARRNPRCPRCAFRHWCPAQAAAAPGPDAVPTPGGAR